MTIMSAEQVNKPNICLSLSCYISEQEFAEFKRKGHYARLTTFTIDGERKAIEVYFVLSNSEYFFNTTPRIEERLKKRPRPQLKKATRPKRKKQPNLSVRKAA